MDRLGRKVPTLAAQGERHAWRAAGPRPDSAATLQRGIGSIHGVISIIELMAKKGFRAFLQLPTVGARDLNRGARQV